MSSRWAPVFLVIALMVATASTVGLYAASQPDVYTSKAVVALTPRSPNGFGATNLKLAATRYSALLSTEQTLRQVAQTTGVSSDTVISATKISVQPNTVTIDINVTLQEAKRAAAVANAIATTALRQSRADELVTVDFIAPGVAPESPSGPNRQLILLGGLGASLVVGAVATIALGFFRNSATLTGALPRRVLAVR